MWVIVGWDKTTAVTKDITRMSTQVLARVMLKPEERHASYITTSDKLLAARYLMELDKVLEPKKAIVPTLVDLLDGDTELAIKVAAGLDKYGWLRTTNPS